MHFLIFCFKIYKTIIKAFSSVGRAAALQAAGHRFESGRAYFIYIFFPKKNYKLFFLFNNRDIIKKDSYFRFYEIIFIYKMHKIKSRNIIQYIFSINGVIKKFMSAQDLPSILVPLVGLVFPAVAMASLFLYVEKEEIN